MRNFLVWFAKESVFYISLGVVATAIATFLMPVSLALAVFCVYMMCVSGSLSIEYIGVVRAVRERQARLDALRKAWALDDQAGT